MPHVRPNRHPEPVAFASLPGTNVEDPVEENPRNEALGRMARLPSGARWTVMQALITFDELELPSNAEVLNHMIDVAERRYVEQYGSLDERPRTVAPRAHDPIVYYLRLDRLVKIGTTGNLRHRFANLPFDTILAVEFGGHTTETQRHHQFADLRHTGEWFRLEQPLLDHVDEVRATFEADVRTDTEAWVYERLAGGSPGRLP